MDEKNFIDELIAEAEAKEELQTAAYFDLLLIDIQRLQREIELNFEEAKKEIEIINHWSLQKNSKIHSRIEWLEKKLEMYIREEKVKTIDLPHGILKMHKKPDKVEIEDIELFLQNAKSELVTVIPEEVKPDLSKIKQYIKSHTIPKGVRLIEGKEEFTYKLKERKEDTDGRAEETGTGTEQTCGLRVAV